jgi:2-oxoisovalerate dehydrogenase E1 component
MAAANPYDYVGLMNTALALDDPVLVIEHVDLYQTKGEVPTDDLDYCIPFGKASLVAEGDEMTIITYLSMVNHAKEAVLQTGVSADLLDLRFLDRASLDWAAIEKSVKKTNNVLIVEQGARGTSYGGWLADEIHRRFFDYLDQPVERVTGSEASPSISKVLERAAIARTEEVVAGISRVVANKGGS